MVRQAELKDGSQARGLSRRAAGFQEIGAQKHLHMGISHSGSKDQCKRDTRSNGW